MGWERRLRTRRRWTHDSSLAEADRWAARLKASDLQPLTLIPLICRTEKLPEPVPEYKFHPTRKWRFDWCWPTQKIALEIEGGVYTRGRHTRGKGYENDVRKYNAATLLGWKVIRATTGMAPEIRDLLVAAFGVTR